MKKKHLIPFLDVLFCLLMVFVCIMRLVKVTTSENDPSFRQRAIYQVVLNWKGNSDIDLWGRDPRHRIVSFNRREGGEGSLFSLNRDNLGAFMTETDEFGNIVDETNEEIVSIRGVIEGEYIFNVHDFNHRDEPPIDVTVKLIKMKPFAELIAKERRLAVSGEQYTMFRFTLDKDGRVVGHNDLPANLVYAEGN